MKLGQTAETALNRWEKSSAISHSLKIGPEEAKAVLNIQLKMDPDMVDIFKLAVKKYGMERGPISHSFLSSPLLAKSAQLSGIKPYFKESLKLTREAGILLANRVVQDWENLPKQMRKTNTEANVQLYFKLATGFELARALFQGSVPWI